MHRTLFAEDAPLAPLSQRILRHCTRYKATLIAALIRVLLSADQQRDPGAIEELQAAVADLIDRAQLEKLSGESVLSREVLFLPGHTLKATDIAQTWWCCMEPERKHLITYEELKPLFAAENIPSPFHNYRHALIDSDGGPSLHRIYQCRADRKNSREQIRRHLTENSKNFSQWLDEGSYRLAVLVTSEARKQAILKIISESYRAAPPLQDIAGITVSVVPTEETFEHMLVEQSVE